MKRMAWASLAAKVATVAALAAFALPARLQAQETPQDAAYRTRREQLLRELEDAQKRLETVRGERVQLQARIENAIALQLQQRSQALLLSNEATALQQLDAILTSSQDNLVAQRDRFLAISEGVRRRSGSVLVVLLRADSSAAQTITSAALSIDNAGGEPRTYSADANRALSLGAVDQLYRANVLPTAHAVALQVTVNGQPLTQSVNVTAGGDAVTYVQFSVRNGQVSQTTWTSRGTTPF